MNSPQRVLITGATGFIGKALVQTLSEAGFHVVLATRRNVEELDGRENRLFKLDEDITPSLVDIDVVIHTAARAHVLKETSLDPAREFRIQNADATRRLARAAAKAGVKRFIFLSSIGVNGNSTRPGQAFRADDVPAPVEPYAISKLEAERALMEECIGASMEWVIIRPPLVYGPGAKGNFERMSRALLRHWPLPFGAIENRRSFVALENLTDLLKCCTTHTSAPEQVLLAADSENYSTAGWLTIMAKGAGVRAHIVFLPEPWLRYFARWIGKRGVIKKLCESLVVDIGPTQARLGWQPRVKAPEVIGKAVRSFTNEGNK